MMKKNINLDLVVFSIFLILLWLIVVSGIIVNQLQGEIPVLP